MKLVYGGFIFQDSGVEVLPSFEASLDEIGRPQEYRWTITAKGMIMLPAGTSAASAASWFTQYEAIMRAALSLTNQNLILFDNQNRPTSISFLAGPTVLIPMQCISLSFPDGGAGEYVTKREFIARFSVSYQSPSVVGTFVSYEESINIQGLGGRSLVWQQAINGPPVPVQANPETTITIQVSGSATGWDAFPPIPNGPLPPQYLHSQSSGIRKSAARRRGSNYRHFPVGWNYVYEGRVGDLRPGTLLPRPWPLNR